MTDDVRPRDEQIPEGRAERTEPLSRAEARRRGEAAYGGVKLGCAFFGWLTASGMMVLLTALLAAAGVAVGLVGDATGADPSADTVGWGGVAVVLLVVLVSYYAGGYVAGRMARFDGARQGLAVFAWSVVAAVVVAVLSAIAGAKFNVLDEVNTFPRIPNHLGEVTALAVVLLLGVVVAAVVGALLGGLAGMHFHRKVEKVVVGHA